MLNRRNKMEGVEELMVEEDGSEMTVGLDENAVLGMMQELEGELQDGGKQPPCSPLLAISVCNESCGPSFSDASATVMASIDLGDLALFYFITDENMKLPEDEDQVLEHETVDTDSGRRSFINQSLSQRSFINQSH